MSNVLFGNIVVARSQRCLTPPHVSWTLLVSYIFCVKGALLLKNFSGWKCRCMMYHGWALKVIQACVAHSGGRVHSRVVRDMMGGSHTTPVPLFLKKHRVVLQPPQQIDEALHQNSALKKKRNCGFKPL